MTGHAIWWATLVLAGSVAGQASGQSDPAYQRPAATLPASEGVSPGDPGPQVAMARRVIDAAGAFDGYMRRASAIRGDFTSGEMVARAVAAGSVYEPTQLGQGAIAYAALIALQDPAFAQAVHDAGRDPATREAYAAQFVAQPQSVLAAPAARREAARVSAALGGMGVRLAQGGAAVGQAAYDIQAQDWSRGAVAGPEDRLARIKARSAVRVSLGPADTAHLLEGLVALRTTDMPSQAEASEVATTPAETQTVSPAVTQGMALAALAVLGKAGEDQAERIDTLLTDPVDGRCLEKAKSDLFDCLATAATHDANLLCLGRNAMTQTGQCIVSAAGMSNEALQPSVDRRSVMVPVALATVPAQGRSDAANPPRPPGEVPVRAAPTAAPPAPPANYSPYAGPTDP